MAAVNKYIVENEPWAVAERDDKDSRARLGTILYTSAEALRIVTALVHPVIPEATARIWAQLGLGEIAQLDLRKLGVGTIAVGGEAGQSRSRVSPRRQEHDRKDATDGTAARRRERDEICRRPKRQPQPGKQSPVRPGAPALSPVVGDKWDSRVPHPRRPRLATGWEPLPLGDSVRTDKIGIEDFLKVELRVGEVKVAEKVKGADKLLRLEVDIGTEVRQIVAGIAKAYDPEKLVGRKVVIVANLQPRKLRGLESNGMIVAASLGDEGQPVLAGFLEDVPGGREAEVKPISSLVAIQRVTGPARLSYV